MTPVYQFSEDESLSNRFKGFAAGLWLCALLGCNGAAAPGGSQPTSTAGGQSVLKVGIVFDSGGLGDKSFNDSAYRGLEKAKADFHIEEHHVDSKTQSDYPANLEALADSGNDLVIAVGGAMQDALEAVAPKYPKVKFAIIDASAKGDNVRSLLFTEEQGSFLAGYLAGIMTKTNKIGFVGGVEIPLIKKFQFGYEAGAKTANPSVEILPAKYVGNWDNVDDGKAAAKVLYESGADIVYHAAGKVGLGVIGAAQEENKYAIGVDSDQDDRAPGHVLTSMIKHVDQAVYDTIKDIKDGKFTAGPKVYSLKDGGVGLSPMTYTKDLVGTANLDKVKSVQDDIIGGKINVPKTEDEYNAYLASMSRK